MLRRLRYLIVPLFLALEGCGGGTDQLPTVPPPPPPGTVPDAPAAPGVIPRPEPGKKATAGSDAS